MFLKIYIWNLVNLYLAVYMLGGYIFVRNVVRNSALLYQSSLFVLHLFEKPCDEPLMGRKQTCSLYFVPPQAVLWWCCRHLAPSTFALSRNPATLRTGYFRGYLDFRFSSWIAVKKKIIPHTNTQTLGCFYCISWIAWETVTWIMKLTRDAVPQNSFVQLHYMSPDGAISFK